MINQKLSVGILFFVAAFNASGQENSPFSRYGLGDALPSQNIINRGMGGVTATYRNFQSVNFNNPASYSAFIIDNRPTGLNYMVYDVGVTLDSRTLKRATPVKKFSTNNLIPSHFALGMPLNKKQNLGLAFGLRPLNSINYSIVSGRNIDPAAKDSVINLYEGDGGLNQVFVGIGKRWKGLSLGINTGYNFGKKNTNTRVFFTDTIPIVAYKSNSATATTYGNFFISGGLQYEAMLKKEKSRLVFGLSGNLKQQLNAKQDIVRETFEYDANGNSIQIDSVVRKNNIEGKIKLPSTYTAGISFVGSRKNKQGLISDNTIISIEYESAKWSQYTFYGLKDNLADSWKLRFGAQITPDKGSVKYLNSVSYQAGFNIGRDYINADGNTLPTYAVTLGAGLPVRKWRSYDNQFANINVALEYGKRGNGNNNITENFFRFSLGLNLSDIWFIKRKYD